MKNDNLKLKIITILVGFILFPVAVFAAELYLEPSEAQYQPGDVFIVDIRIDTKEECINIIEANLSFSQDILEAVDFSKGNSILTVWVEAPKINQNSGSISFSAGIPGGYCGKIPEDPGESNLLGKLVFRARETDAKLIRETDAKLEFLDTCQVLLNDGFGTPAKLITQGAIFTILPEKSEIPKDEWQEELQKDIILPEPFEIKIHQNAAIFEGKYFITFFTTDKQTGLDYYEIKQGKRDWKKAASPYLLEDQTLQSIIKVKAVDKAGQERIAEYIPEITESQLLYWVIVLIAITLIFIVIKKFKIKIKK